MGIAQCIACKNQKFIIASKMEDIIKNNDNNNNNNNKNNNNEVQNEVNLLNKYDAKIQINDLTSPKNNENDMNDMHIKIECLEDINKKDKEVDSNKLTKKNTKEGNIPHLNKISNNNSKLILQIKQNINNGKNEENEQSYLSDVNTPVHMKLDEGTKKKHKKNISKKHVNNIENIQDVDIIENPIPLSARENSNEGKLITIFNKGKESNVSPNYKGKSIITINIFGPKEAGKTAFIILFSESRFESFYVPTFGNEIGNKKYVLNNKYYKIKFIVSEKVSENLNFCFVIFDITNNASFKEAVKIIDEKLSNVKVPLFLLGNKCDYKARGTDLNTINEFCDKNKYFFFEISIKDNTGISSVMKKVGELLN